MIFEDCLSAALDTVLAWDLPDDACAEAVAVQACLLAGLVADEIPSSSVET
jgi:hypothetical protein